MPETGVPIVVKKLNQRGCQGQQEWLMTIFKTSILINFALFLGQSAEIKYLGQLCHPNLVKLIGYCLEDDQWLLIYEFMPNGSLEKYILKVSDCPFLRLAIEPCISRCKFLCDLKHVLLETGSPHFQPLSWNLRMKVALGAARGLRFLHDEVHVIYRDFKASNILFDGVCENVQLMNLFSAADMAL
ncbi:hypothetical protein GH714_035200 [Hevea brasiliensis]|uniref:Protein kinase domain-containing protein n=1 Tax=Hevea brasiliensis TaxID=3981 RepID=A0A6A6L3E0_HEVBR|nr:hypothetical protein GH714_035200 [Hevea brasiliensis]